MLAPEPLIVRPQPGAQEAFLASAADIAIFGGAAGGGKTWALLVEPLRHIAVPGFNFVAFRRVTPMIRNPGGLWDEAMALYPLVGGVPTEQPMDWDFPSGARGKFAGLQYESDVFAWKGAQIVLAMFDQLEEFTERQFFYMLSRLRSMCGVVPYVRATCNPDPDSFLADFLAWWIDPETGYAIAARSGVVRWFIRVHDTILWADSAAELLAAHPGTYPKSVTFIHASVYDNKVLLAANPEYVGNLQALALVERERLLGGNWKIRPAAGLVFNRGWFTLIDAAPAVATRVRYWDKAGTAGGGDWTVGVRMAHTAEHVTYVEDVVRGQWSAGERERVIQQTAAADGVAVTQWFEQEPGSGGKESAEATVTALAGYDAHAAPATGDKVQRANPFAAQAEAGNARLVRGAWNEAYLRELHAFPTKGVPDDQVDASSGAFNKLALGRVGILDYYAQQARQAQEQTDART